MHTLYACFLVQPMVSMSQPSNKFKCTCQGKSTKHTIDQHRRFDSFLSKLIHFSQFPASVHLSQQAPHSMEYTGHGRRMLKINTARAQTHTGVGDRANKFTCTVCNLPSG
mmetsp:Transcript_18339/g.29840  ORF Transcript_18339/g.29840 Transcript_18339/m.29840 type:complete len:110 (-) Transcript_18339:14-343(-)